MQRRKFLGTSFGAMIAGLSTSVLAGSPAVSRSDRGSHRAPPSAGADASARAIRSALASIEKSVDGRLGVAVQDMETGMQTGYRMEERFPMCSTFKLLLTAAVLARVDEKQEDLQHRVVFTPDRIDRYAPVTRNRTGEPGMTVDALCEATMILSDNTAANLLLDRIGGPAGFTAFARRLGDTVTQLDRIEPFLNEALPGDPRDTTTPLAMLGNLRKVLLGEALSPGSRTQLLVWAIGNRTGGARLRAGVPSDWRVGDKTGTGERGTTNDIGILWPQDRAPILVTVYITQANAPAAARDTAIAEVARTIVRYAA